MDHPRRRRHRLQSQAGAHSCSPWRRCWLRSRPPRSFRSCFGLVKIGGGLGIGSIALMLLGTQWYILFNVIAGAMSIPSDLREVASLYQFTRWQRWTGSFSPASFPISSPAWSRPRAARGTPRSLPSTSHIGDQHACRPSAWARRSAPPLTGPFLHPAAGHHPDPLMVVTMNRLVWRRLYRLAETRYKLEG